MKAQRRSFAVEMSCLLLVAVAAPAIAQTEPTELINRQHCMFCHTTDAPFLAPSFRQIAERYKSDPHAAGVLARKLRLGGRAHWGDTPMPPPSERGGPLSARDARTLVDWVMKQ